VSVPPPYRRQSRLRVEHSEGVGKAPCMSAGVDTGFSFPVQPLLF
jgi:hypothetical protein